MNVEVKFDSLGGGDTHEFIRPTADGSGYPTFTWDFDAKCIVVFGSPSTAGANVYQLESPKKRWWANQSYGWQVSNSPNVTNVTSRSITINEFGTSWSSWGLCAIPMEEYPDGYFT